MWTLGELANDPSVGEVWRCKDDGFVSRWPENAKVVVRRIDGPRIWYVTMTGTIESMSKTNFKGEYIKVING